MYVSNTPLFCRYFTSTKKHGFFYERSFLLNQDYVELIVSQHLFRMKVVYCIKFFSWDKKIFIEHVFTNIFFRVLAGRVGCLILGTMDFVLLCFPFSFCGWKNREREPKESFLKTHLHKSAEYFFFKFKMKIIWWFLKNCQQYFFSYC